MRGPLCQLHLGLYMNNAMSIVKFIGAWFCIVGAVVLLVLEPHGAFGLPGVLSLLSIAFSQAPSGA